MDNRESGDTTSKRFRIAFSFAGEKREFVEKVARILADRFGEDRILYDKFHEAEFARNDLGIYLPNLYNRDTDLVVVVVCPNYDVKEWTGLEWLAIHDLLQQRHRDEVMLCRFDHAHVDGLFRGAGFIELDHKTPEQFAKLILERLAINESKPKDHYTKSIPPSGDTPPARPASRRSWIVAAVLLVVVAVGFGMLMMTRAPALRVVPGPFETQIPLEQEQRDNSEKQWSLEFQVQGKTPLVVKPYWGQEVRIGRGGLFAISAADEIQIKLRNAVNECVEWKCVVLTSGSSKEPQVFTLEEKPFAACP